LGRSTPLQIVVIQDDLTARVPTGRTHSQYDFLATRTRLQCSCYVLITFMSDRPASWRMPTLKQMEKMAAERGKPAEANPGLAPNHDLPAEYWRALLDDPRAQAKPTVSGEGQRLSQIARHVLRVSCRRCARTVEIQKSDAVRLYGPDATWKHVSQRLLANTCTQSTGRHEEDGCWPSYDLGRQSR